MLDVARVHGALRLIGNGKSSWLLRLPGHHSFQLQLREWHVAIPNLPQGLDGLELVQISDLHIARCFEQRFFEAVVDACQGWSADLLFMTGDLVEDDETIGWVEPLLSPLQARLGKFAILGNHDKEHHPQAISSELVRAGFEMLEARWTTLDVAGSVLAHGRDIATLGAGPRRQRHARGRHSSPAQPFARPFLQSPALGDRPHALGAQSRGPNSITLYWSRFHAQPVFTPVRPWVLPPEWDAPLRERGGGGQTPGSVWLSAGSDEARAAYRNRADPIRRRDSSAHEAKRKGVRNLKQKHVRKGVRMAIATCGRHGCLAVFAALLLACSGARAADENPRAVLNERHKILLQNHCVKCHNADKTKGKFRVDNLPFTVTNRESAERWQKVLHALNSGAMPPEPEKQPDDKAKTDFLDDLAQVMVAVRRSLSDQRGVITMRRLNRREYRNTLRELLGVEIDVNELPADTGTGGFDTAGSNLFMSSDQFEQYLALGREALDEAFDRHAHAATTKNSDSKRKTSLTEWRATCTSASNGGGNTCCGRKRSTLRRIARKTASSPPRFAQASKTNHLGISTIRGRS